MFQGDCGYTLSSALSQQKREMRESPILPCRDSPELCQLWISSVETVTEPQVIAMKTGKYDHLVKHMMHGMNFTFHY
jgi:hypothetical protein